MKDDRTSASENQMCMGFFFFFFLPANTQTLKRSDTVQGRNHAPLQAGMWLWANQVSGAKLSLWSLVPSNSGFSELGKDDTCLRPFHGFQLNSAGALLDAHAGHLPPPAPGIFHCLKDNRCYRICLVGAHPCVTRQEFRHHWVNHWPMSSRSQWIHFLLCPWLDCPEKQLFIWPLGRVPPKIKQLIAFNTSWCLNTSLDPPVGFPCLISASWHCTSS